MPENILDLGVEPVQSLVCGSYLGWRVTTDWHAPRYAESDVLFTDREGRVAGVVPAREQENGAASVSKPGGR